MKIMLMRIQKRLQLPNYLFNTLPHFHFSIKPLRQLFTFHSEPQKLFCEILQRRKIIFSPFSFEHFFNANVNFAYFVKNEKFNFVTFTLHNFNFIHSSLLFSFSSFYNFSLQKEFFLFSFIPLSCKLDESLFISFLFFRFAENRKLHQLMNGM